MRFFTNTAISPYSLFIRLTLEIISSLFAKMVHFCTNTSVVEAERVCLEGGVL
jgi:hypothetical protein